MKWILVLFAVVVIVVGVTFGQMNGSDKKAIGDFLGEEGPLWRACSRYPILKPLFFVAFWGVVAVATWLMVESLKAWGWLPPRR